MTHLYCPTPGCGEYLGSLGSDSCRHCGWHAAEPVDDSLVAENERLRAFGEKVNAIRNSIIGAQRINWSEHVYPLVAALDEAGFEGLEYDRARATVGTLIEQRDAAEAKCGRLTEILMACRPYVQEAYEQAGRGGTPLDRRTEDEIGALVDSLDAATKGEGAS